MKKPKSNQPQQQYMQNPYMSPNYPYYMPQPQQPQPGGQQVQGQGQSQGGPPPTSSGGSGAPQDPNQLPIEESYIENILRLNRGKIATVYMTFENNTQWNAKVFRGEIEAAGRDYITFEGPIKYNYPFSGGGQQLSNYSPR